MHRFQIATMFHPYGFHRDRGPFPGVNLAKKLTTLYDQAKNDNSSIVIDLTGMKAFYRSFADGAFGIFIDELKMEFFTKFNFIYSDNTFTETMYKVFEDHKEKGFNAGVKKRV